jgi:hypothetical protein
MTAKKKTCAFDDKEATRKVDARALGKRKDSLPVCDEHYAIVKAWWSK